MDFKEEVLNYKIFYKLSLKKGNEYLFEKVTISILDEQNIYFIPSLNDTIYFEKKMILDSVFNRFRDLLDEDSLDTYFKVINKSFYYYIDDKTNLKNCEITILLDGDIIE